MSDLRCPGVGRDADNIYALQFYFNRRVTDDEMRYLHDVMRRAVACSPRINPRDPDPSRPGIFRDHTCWKCRDGAKPCVAGNPRQCEYPHARND